MSDYDKYSRPNYPPPSQNNQPNYGNDVYQVPADLETAQFGKLPDPSQNFDQSFKIEKPRYNDWPFTIIFLLVVAGFVAVAGITLNALRQTFSFQGGSIYDSSNSFTVNTNTIILFSFVIVVAIVLSAALIIYARLAPKTFIVTGLIFNIILGLGTSIFYFVEHYYSAAIVFLVFTLLTAWCYWSARRRIPLSATILTIAIDVMKAYPSTLVVSFVGMIISAAFSVLFSVVLVATYVKFEPNNNNEACSAGGGSCFQAKVIGVLVFVMFAGYYISEVFRNIIHVTISGVYGTWYYLANSDQGAPRLPALGALRRALTYCFGSISFGSLIVALIQLVRSLLQILRQSLLNNGEGWAACLVLIIDFLVSFVESLVRYFNHYAYCYIALYGKSYIKSAKDTFDLLRYKGMDVLVNDCFINTSLNLYALFVGYLTALLAYLYLRFTSPAYNSDGNYYAPVIAFAFLIAGQITRVSLTVIESGTSSFFVALAKDPEIFQMTNRDKFDAIFRDYPQVLQKLTSNH
ncbi:plasma-membrane choline transporter-domain-containing protein [Scheffersomyces coipomensis]|uniref:plasma-membrane choline transporter-domain-containing protein n=1 Tax=Scheffersomyces coipomensis TaxID=1788519 RepID=UPI00315DB38F